MIIEVVTVVIIKIIIVMVVVISMWEDLGGVPLRLPLRVLERTGSCM
jgi:hypothetical protein